MKRIVKKLVLTKETVRRLEASDLEKAVGRDFWASFYETCDSVKVRCKANTDLGCQIREAPGFTRGLPAAPSGPSFKTS